MFAEVWFWQLSVIPRESSFLDGLGMGVSQKGSVSPTIPIFLPLFVFFSAPRIFRGDFPRFPQFFGVFTAQRANPTRGGPANSHLFSWAPKPGDDRRGRRLRAARGVEALAATGAGETGTRRGGRCGGVGVGWAGWGGVRWGGWGGWVVEVGRLPLLLAEMAERLIEKGASNRRILLLNFPSFAVMFAIHQGCLVGCGWLQYLAALLALLMTLWDCFGA